MKLAMTISGATFACLIALPVHAAPTDAQKCEADVELASAKYGQCRLNAESKHSKTLDGTKRTAALAKCSEKLGAAFSKANAKYGPGCAATEPSADFDAYLTQCSDDVAAAAAGAPLPEYLASIATCNADLATCSGELAATSGDLAACTGDLATCESRPTARVLKTGQLTSLGAGSDGQLGFGVPRNFVDNGDGTLTDTATGLMWEKNSDDGTIHDKDTLYTWNDAFSVKLAALNGAAFAGHTDWRVPNLFELETLRDLENPPPSVVSTFHNGCIPGCSVLTCSCTASASYWSSSATSVSWWAGIIPGAWLVNFTWGDSAMEWTTSTARVRAVRAGT